MDVSDSLIPQNAADPDFTENKVGKTLADLVLIRRISLFAGLAVSGAAIDLWTKEAIFRWRGLPGQQDVWWIVEGIFGVETAVNPGAVFGIGAGRGVIFAVFSVLAAIGILVWLFWFKAARSLWLTCALGLITGGIVGNLYDRLGFWWHPQMPIEWKSGVRDWILFRIEGVPLLDPWPNFNIADSLLVVGACMLLIQSLFLDDTRGTSTSTEPTD